MLNFLLNGGVVSSSWSGEEVVVFFIVFGCSYKVGGIVEEVFWLVNKSVNV